MQVQILIKSLVVPSVPTYGYVRAGGYHTQLRSNFLRCLSNIGILNTMYYVYFYPKVYLHMYSCVVI